MDISLSLTHTATERKQFLLNALVELISINVKFINFLGDPRGLDAGEIMRTCLKVNNLTDTLVFNVESV